MTMDRSYSEEEGLIHWKTSIGLEPVGSQKERKTGETWKKKGLLWRKQKYAAKHGARC